MSEILPENLERLHFSEAQLRENALKLVAADEDMKLHLRLIELSMSMAEGIRMAPTDDEDFKVIKMLAMRTFNAFASCLKLGLSGYFQNSTLIMRDLVETLFLQDLFQGDRSLIERWRFADKAAFDREFRPVKVREALDKRDGFDSRKRAEHYKMLSVLAGHPNMNSSLMMRPEQGGDAVVGPYMNRGTLKPFLEELGRLAVQVGEILDLFLPNDWVGIGPTRIAFSIGKTEWMARYYPQTTIKGA